MIIHMKSEGRTATRMEDGSGNNDPLPSKVLFQIVVKLCFSKLSGRDPAATHYILYVLLNRGCESSRRRRWRYGSILVRTSVPVAAQLSQCTNSVLGQSRQVAASKVAEISGGADGD